MQREAGCLADAEHWGLFKRYVNVGSHEREIQTSQEMQRFLIPACNFAKLLTFHCCLEPAELPACSEATEAFRMMEKSRETTLGFRV